MSRTFIKQSTQIAKSDQYQDNLTPGASLESSAVTVQDDLNALRSMVKAATGASNWYAAPSESISGLNSRLTTAEGDIDTLTSDLAAESAARVSADNTLQSNIDSEANARSSADTVLQGNIDAEASARSSADTLLQSNIDAEASARAAADGVLQSNIDAEAIARAAADSSEASARAAADTTLQNNIDAEASARSSADTTLQNNIDAEASARAAAVSAEASARQSADSLLQTNIDNEASARAAADTTLQSNIDAEASTRAAADSALSSSLNQEISDRQAADATLQSNIDAEAGARSAADLVLQGNIDAEASARSSADNALQTNIDNEANARSSADFVLQGNIDAEAAARAAADEALDARLTTAEGEIDALQSDYASLSTAVILKDGSVAFTGDQSMGGYSLTDVASPSNALDVANKAYVDSVAQGLRILAPVEAKYDFQGGEQPSVPTLPSEPASPTFFGTTYTVTTEAELDAALAAVIDGDVIMVPLNTTVTLTSSKTINKSIKIYGKNQSSSVFSASFAVSPNSGLFIVSGKKADGVTQNNNVMFSTLSITSSSNANDHACIVANTLSTAFPNGSTGIRFENLTLNHTEFGITVAADSWVVKGCTFNYLPVSGAADTHRHLGIYNISTMGWVENCSFPATTEATPRTIAMLLTAADYDFTPNATKSGGYAGNFVVKGCSQLSGNLRQWLVMEVFKANGLNSAPMAEHGFSMWLENNTSGITSGGAYILSEGSGSKAPLDFFNVIYTSNNVSGESTGTDKGMIAVDGLGSARSAGAPSALYVNVANSGSAFTAPLSGTYVQGSTTDNLLAINSTYFNSPSPSAKVTVQAPTSGGPIVPSGEFVNVGGYVAMAGDRIFVVDSYSAVASGIYVVSAGDWARSDDYAANDDVASTFFFVKMGDFADTSWVEIADPAIVGTDPLTFAQFSGPGTYTGTGAINVSAQNVISVVESGITTSMLSDSAVSTAKLADGAVITAKLADNAVTNDKILDGTIAEAKLAFDVTTPDELAAGLATKLSLSGGTMTGELNMNYQLLTHLVDPENPKDAATKSYVDAKVDNLDSRLSKTYSVVQADQQAFAVLYGGNNGPLDIPLPVMPSDPTVFASTFDVYLNGQLLRPAALVNNQLVDMDVSRDATNNQALVLSFAAKAGDVLCVVAYT